MSQAKGLSLNSKKIRAEKAGAAVTDRGFMNMDIQMCTSVPHMFTIGEMIGEVALAIEMGADAVDIGKTIHPHPTLGESIGMAAEVAHGSCTDLPPAENRPSFQANTTRLEPPQVRAFFCVSLRHTAQRTHQ